MSRSKNDLELVRLALPDFVLRHLGTLLWIATVSAVIGLVLAFLPRGGPADPVRTLALLVALITGTATAGSPFYWAFFRPKMDDSVHDEYHMSLNRRAITAAYNVLVPGVLLLALAVEIARGWGFRWEPSGPFLFPAFVILACLPAALRERLADFSVPDDRG